MKPATHTSRAAYLSAPINELERLVLDVITAAGVNGCISDEVRACYPSLSYSSVTARFSALEKKGELYRAGDTRVGDSGRQQKVMRAAFHSSTVPVVIPPAAKVKSKRNPFLAGMMHAARVVIAQPDLNTARAALKAELVKVASK